MIIKTSFRDPFHSFLMSYLQNWGKSLEILLFSYKFDKIRRHRTKAEAVTRLHRISLEKFVNFLFLQRKSKRYYAVKNITLSLFDEIKENFLFLLGFLIFN